MNKHSLFQILDWDSQLFGYKVAKINTPNLESDKLKKLLSELSRINIRLVYWFVDPKNEISNKAAEYDDGLLVDSKITYIIDIDNYHSRAIDHQHIFSYTLKSLNKQLLSLAFQSGSYSRFKLDKNFMRNEYNKLYTIWIEKSLSGEIAKDIIVYVKNNLEIGLITLEIKGNHGLIGLLAVDKKYQGKSIGKQLINAALIKFKAMGIKKVKVVSQKKNIIACKFYERNGFIQENVQNVYHFWLNE